MYGYVIEKKSFFQQKYPNGFIQQISTKTEKDTLRKTEIISTVCVCVCCTVTMCAYVTLLRLAVAIWLLCSTLQLTSVVY